VSQGLPSRGLASSFFLRLLGVETILQLYGGGVLQPCRGRRTAAAQPGCSILSSVRATVASRTGGSHNTSYAARAVLVFWGGPILVFVAMTGVRTCWCALGQLAPAGAVLVGRWLLSLVLRWWPSEKASLPTRPSAPPLRTDLRLFVFDSLSSPLEWGRGRGPCRSSVCPEVIAAADGVGGGEPPAILSSHRPSNVGVVRTRGSGTGVPFVMVFWVPVYVHCGCRGLNI
jgi:hypothetical protein